MLTHLSVHNIVLIEECRVEFSRGLNVLTGETGAGKSILLDALSLALGARGDSALLRRGADQGSVTAAFDIAGHKPLAALLTELGMAADDALVLRRTITPDGKTRAFVNDEPVSVSGLKRIGDALLEIHGQHDQQGLMDSSTHLDMLDAYGELSRAKVEQHFALWKEQRDALHAAQMVIENARREEDFLRHIYKELAALDPKPGEEVALADQRLLMMQGEKLVTLLDDVIGELRGAKPVAAALRTAQRMLLRSALNVEERFANMINSLEKAQTELEEAEAAVEEMAQASSFNADKLEVLEERLYSLREAGRKYNLPVDELANLLAEVEGKLNGLDRQHDTLGALEGLVDAAKNEYAKEATILSAARQKVARTLEKTVHAELAPLKMASTKFRVSVEQMAEDAWNARGADAVRFEAATNAGTDFAPLTKIASGGELSRFMLACKVVLSKVKSAPTMIFDEIDTGTGGAVADAIGERLARLSGEVQVLVVTHLPQVAAKGTQHYRISKEEKKGKTLTSVERLSDTERKEELARMLSGADVTDEARRAATRLMKAV